MLLYICVLLCFVVFLKTACKFWTSLWTTEGNNVPVAEELYCIFNILTMCILIMYVNYFSQYTCDVMVHIQLMVGLLM